MVKTMMIAVATFLLLQLGMSESDMPKPFSRVLAVTDPVLTGNDVLIGV